MRKRNTIYEIKDLPEFGEPGRVGSGNMKIETLKLLRDKKSLSALLEGHRNRKQNKVKGKSIDQVFGDV